MSMVVGNDDLAEYEDYERDLVSSPDQFGSGGASDTWGIELGERKTKKNNSTKN